MGRWSPRYTESRVILTQPSHRASSIIFIVSHSIVANFVAMRDVAMHVLLVKRRAALEFISFVVFWGGGGCLGQKRKRKEKLKNLMESFRLDP